MLCIVFTFPLLPYFWHLAWSSTKPQEALGQLRGVDKATTITTLQLAWSLTTALGACKSTITHRLLGARFVHSSTVARPRTLTQHSGTAATLERVCVNVWGNNIECNGVNMTGLTVLEWLWMQFSQPWSKGQKCPIQTEKWVQIDQSIWWSLLASLSVL